MKEKTFSQSCKEISDKFKKADKLLEEEEEVKKKVVNNVGNKKSK